VVTCEIKHRKIPKLFQSNYFITHVTRL